MRVHNPGKAGEAGRWQACLGTEGIIPHRFAEYNPRMQINDLPQELLDAEGRGHRLKEYRTGRPLLLVFLRHLG
ncbi:MAG: hypothetical protein U0840_08995 [Gemmataceae bacterium]